MNELEEDDCERIEKLPQFQEARCGSCGASFRVHTLRVYGRCSQCGTEHKFRFLGGGVDASDLIEASLKWAGVSVESVISAHQRQNRRRPWWRFW